jgi:hypothetical protein
VVDLLLVAGKPEMAREIANQVDEPFVKSQIEKSFDA